MSDDTKKAARDRLSRLAGGADPLEVARARAGGQREPGKLYLSKAAPVSASADLERILALPRRSPLDLSSPRAEALAEMITARYARKRSPGTCPCGCGMACACAEIDPKIAAGKRRCIRRLKPVQAWALYEIGVAGGLVAHVPVGGGKTAIDLLSPLPLRDHGVNLSLLLVPPNLLQQLYRDAQLIGEHFELTKIVIHGIDKRVEPPGARGLLHVLPYSRLSLPTSGDWVRNLSPDAIIADECHRLKSAAGAGSSRIMRYASERGDARPVRFCGWTGTLTDQSITEFGHLLVLALRERSPLPIERQALEEWARAVDAVDNPAPPGELGRLCDDEREDEDPNTTAGARAGFGRRMAETLGVVISTEASAANVELVVRERPAPELPPRVQEALSKVRDCWVRPDSMVSDDPDEELVDAFQVAKVARELASGIFYRWRYPLVGGQPQRREVIKEWLEARRDYNREQRTFLRDRREWLDSPHLCEHAAQRFWGDRPKRDDRPEWECVTWPRWRDMKSRVVYEVEACRVSDYLAVDAAQWATENLGIVWYGMVEFGQWVSELSGLPQHGGGPEAEVRLIGGEHKGRKYRGEIGDRSIIASIKSHGVGRDGLQVLFCRQLIAQPPSSASIFEQLLGRTARDGQTESRVEADFYAHTAEYRAAYEQAVLRAQYVAGVTGQQQMILRGAPPADGAR